MAFIWSSVFILLGSVLQRRRPIIIYMYFFPLLFISVLSIIRLFTSVELPFTKVIHSKIILPKIMGFLNIPLLTFRGFTVHVYTILLLVWIAGTVTLWIKTVLHYIHFRRFRKHIQTKPETVDNKVSVLVSKIILSGNSMRKVKVIQTSLLSTPLLTGLFKPVIYLPNIPFTDTELEYILRHELTHYINKDLWIKFLLNIIYSVFWWNPFLYLLKRNTDHLLELKTDLSLARQLSEKSRTQYLETILKVVKYQSSLKHHQKLSSVGIGFASSNSGRKIRQRFQLVDCYKPMNWLQKSANWCICILMLVSFFLSFSFIVQPYIDHPPNFNDSEMFIINGSNSYLIDNKDGSYSLYSDGIYMTNIYNITDEPFSSFTIKEK